MQDDAMQDDAMKDDTMRETYAGWLEWEMN